MTGRLIECEAFAALPTNPPEVLAKWLDSRSELLCLGSSVV
jgi:hypothetical protein